MPYLYVGVVHVGGIRGYLWLLGRRVYLRIGWRRGDTLFLGNLSDPLRLAARLARLVPRVDVRRAVTMMVRALRGCMQLLERGACRDRPPLFPFEVYAAVEEALYEATKVWPSTRRVRWAPLGPPR